MTENCANCRFSYLGTQGNPEEGLCRRYPPNSDGRWAEVLRFDWCGEYAPIERVAISIAPKKTLVEVTRRRIIERNKP